jgi:hypothetical protein
MPSANVCDDFNYEIGITKLQLRSRNYEIGITQFQLRSRNNEVPHLCLNQQSIRVPSYPLKMLLTGAP